MRWRRVKRVFIASTAARGPTDLRYGLIAVNTPADCEAMCTHPDHLYQSSPVLTLATQVLVAKNENKKEHQLYHIHE